ncbi:lymphocyte antigen 6G6e-like isoform X3 [Myotis daubentonii]|uniref:lymphocyte antigen 6G6e-like isoform X3 n=1 Tax=Myotis daubentonii TaxID=98922 RepID=UPI0028736CB6|nr:lymphocyte antigen 6G6e-like isoform X3 [Myotis daubentonii]
MGTSRAVLCILFFCGALGKGLTTLPARGRLHCYTCSFAKPCYPVPTECGDDEACGVSIGTSDTEADALSKPQVSGKAGA